MPPLRKQLRKKFELNLLYADFVILILFYKSKIKIDVSSRISSSDGEGPYGLWIR